MAGEVIVYASVAKLHASHPLSAEKPFTHNSTQISNLVQLSRESRKTWAHRKLCNLLNTKSKNNLAKHILQMRLTDTHHANKMATGFEESLM